MASTSAGTLTSVAAPRKFDFGFDAVRVQITLRHVDQFGRDTLALHILRAANLGAFGDGQNPAIGPRGRFGIDQFADFVDVHVVFQDVVVAGDARVQNAVGDVALGFPERAIARFRVRRH